MPGASESPGSTSKPVGVHRHRRNSPRPPPPPARHKLFRVSPDTTSKHPRRTPVEALTKLLWECALRPVESGPPSRSVASTSTNISRWAARQTSRDVHR